MVAHAGYGRRDVAPYSDVDLMILHSPGVGERVAPLAERLLRDVFDAGLILGHSVRTPDQAWRLACSEPMICTSLVESRLVRGSTTLFSRYKISFAGMCAAAPAGSWRASRRTVRKSASAMAKRSSSWSRTSNGRAARCATSN